MHLEAISALGVESAVFGQERIGLPRLKNCHTLSTFGIAQAQEPLRYVQLEGRAYTPNSYRHQLKL